MREYVLVFLVAAAVTYLLTVVAREIAVRSGAVAPVRDRDVHAEPVPYLGGIAMLGGLFAAFLVARELPFLSGSKPFVFDDTLSVLFAGALVCAVGVLDDIFDLDALTKFGGQVVAVGVLIYSGIQFRYFFFADGRQFSLDGTQGALLTAVIVLATVNAVNFIDGLDGLAAGVIGISALAFFVFCYRLTVVNEVERATTGALLSAALAGACVGFLVHNFHPARLFMGDSGSMLIGLVLSSTAITVTTQFSDVDIAQGEQGARASLLPMLLPAALPILILVVPLADLLMAVVRRTAAGRSPFAPDKQHLHHRLLEIGHSHRRAVLIMWLWAGLIAFGTVVASLYDEVVVWISIGSAFVLTVALTFVVPLLPKWGHRDKEVDPDPDVSAQKTL
ncbi:undecaprenyl/decaprenyl-phosphate alpha-N-acetylglucosaminyl 1-phosphate transferase [Nocardioides humilatus]|uniref:Undecaprenyl/decaprenyl-phosphate alpha-N-acetylglucosaminyl 1-phosphate transferase n=1 Tax=Nocardioides humilatus TaxID=2607660 RepID=A0A5B1LJD9_9ACTN|nr:MraY family glycosyltransferase [Nocardioides humilatus]KAA1420845.1 undecaprenyl/decaprenyl-phosphate alpha-N-acetylglucosaminyl 1-phosphate transferase [Nocardioides humilatus]